MIAIVIQARMNAQRLPNKPMEPIGEHTLLGWTILAAQASRLAEAVIVATTTNPLDDSVVAHAREYGAEVFRGSAEDVLARYLHCAEHFALDVIVRVSGDSPLWSPWVGDFVIAQREAFGVDYAANCVAEVFPLGVQAEAFTREALAASVALADRPTDHEHVTPALRRHYPRFSVLSILAPPPLERPHYRLCVDNEDDLAVVKELFANVPHPPQQPPDLLDICRFLDENPTLVARNVYVQQKYRTGQDLQGSAPTVVLPLAYREAFYQTAHAARARDTRKAP